MALPKYVSSFKDRHGRERYRFRSAGVYDYLHGEPGSEEFEARAADLLARAEIARSKLASVVRYPAGEVVYFIGNSQHVKIGTTNKVARRLGELQIGSQAALRLLAHAPGGAALEREYHERFAHLRKRGEWFRRAPELTAEIRRLDNLWRVSQKSPK